MLSDVESKQLEDAGFVYEMYRERKRAMGLVDKIISDAKKAGTGDKGKFWKVVTDLDTALERLYPKEYQILLTEIARERASRTNEFASNKDKSFRHLAKIPVAIWGSLRLIYGEELPYTNKRFQREFAKRFPG
jgi:hypothetical protein